MAEPISLVEYVRLFAKTSFRKGPDDPSNCAPMASPVTIFKLMASKLSRANLKASRMFI